MSFRRSFRLKITPVIFLLLSIVGWIFHRASVLLLFLGAFALWWLIVALAQFSKRLSLEADAIRMHGYLGGPIVIARPDVTSCRYVRLQPQGRDGIDMFFLEIRDAGGHGIRVWRYGWGRQRHQLFKLLTAWITDCPIKPDSRTSEFLDSMT